MKKIANFFARQGRIFKLGLMLGWTLPLYAYHPFSTDDPGTVEFRHFEMEWGNDGVFLDSNLDDISGYLQIKSGLAEGLELDLAQTFTYWRDSDYGEPSGFGDTEVALKYRFYGDGDGAFNLGIEAIFTLPSGEEDKGLSVGDDIVPCFFIIGTAGKEPVRLILNAGATVPAEAPTAWLMGALLEYSVNEELALGIEFYGESNLRGRDSEDALEVLVGGAYSPKDWLTLGTGVSIGLDEDSPDFRLTFSLLTGW